VFIDFGPEKSPLCVQLLQLVLRMVALPIDDELQPPPQQGFMRFLRNFTKTFKLWYSPLKSLPELKFST
jgi:hypothetical protein